MASNDDAAEPAPKRQRGDRVTLDVGGETFVCGSSTLTSSSAYFASLLSDNWIESNDGDEIFLDQDPAAFRKLLAFMRRGMIKIEDVDIDVLALAEFLGVELLLTGAKVRWYCNLGRGPLVSGKTDGDIAALFDQEYGGITDAVSRGLLPRFHSVLKSETEKDLAEFRIELVGTGQADTDVSYSYASCVNGDNPTRIYCDSLVGCLNGLFADGYIETQVALEKYGPVPHGEVVRATLTSVLSRRRHSDIRSEATKIFIPTNDEARHLRKASYKTQLGCFAKTRDGQETVVAPSDFCDNEQERANPCATVMLENTPESWMRNHGFRRVEEPYKQYEEGIKTVMNLFDVEFEKVELYQREVALG